MQVLAKHVEHKTLQEFRDAFGLMDSTGIGFIEYPQFIEALLVKGFSRSEAQKVFEYVDFKQDGRICFVEFIGATMQFKTDIPEQKLIEAFDNMDFDGDGYISGNDLSKVLDQPEFLMKRYVWRASRAKQDPKSECRVDVGQAVIIMLCASKNLLC